MGFLCVWHIPCSCVCVLIANTMTLYNGVHGSPVESCVPDMVRTIEGYVPSQGMYCSHNEPSLKIPQIDCEMLVPNGTAGFYDWIAGLESHTCQCPLMNDMITGGPEDRHSITLAACITAYNPDNLISDFIVGNIKKIGHRVSAACLFDDETFGRPQLPMSGWRQVEGHKLIGVTRS